MEMTKKDDRDLNLEATELRLGLPGGIDDSEKRRCNKRAFSSDANDQEFGSMNNSNRSAAPASKAQIVGWPPIRSYRKNCLQLKKTAETESAGNFIKVSMDGAPYLRKIDLKVYNGYTELLKAMEDMFKFSVGEGYNGSGFVPTYEDKDGDWMLVGDVPWEMFITSCKRLRIMKGSEARGLGCCVV